MVRVDLLGLGLGIIGIIKCRKGRENEQLPEMWLNAPESTIQDQGKKTKKC